MDTGGSSRSRDNNGSSHFCLPGDDEEVRYGCNYRLRIQTCNKAPNRGRRFMSCPIRGESTCGFFKWYDVDTSDHSTDLVHRLLDKIETYENEIALHKLREARLKMIVVACLVSTLVCLMLLVARD